MPHVEQELLTLPEHLISTTVFSVVRVAQSVVFCGMFCRSFFVLLAIVLSVLLWFTTSDYPFGTFNHFFSELLKEYRIYICIYFLYHHIWTLKSYVFKTSSRFFSYFQRVKLFRRNVVKEKEAMGLTESACTSPQSTLISVHRSRIVEVNIKYFKDWRCAVRFTESASLGFSHLIFYIEQNNIIWFGNAIRILL
jgi:hypothetical protein